MELGSVFSVVSTGSRSKEFVVSEDAKIKPYSGPAGGWGSVKAVRDILTQEEVGLLGSKILH
jgi:hypothetical protein